jgi:peroxiredoxin
MAEGRTETKTLKVGDEAPEFVLRDSDLQEWKLSDQRGKSNVVLNFFPGAFSPGCSAQMPRIQEQKALFERDTVVLGLSPDGPFALKAFKKDREIDFPLLSDFYPHGAVAEKYGVLLPLGVPERAVIGIDKDGKVRYIHIGPIQQVPDLTECALTMKGEL